MTVKLYLESIEAAYARTFDAQVVAIDGNSIVLDRTLFYPLGGGQHWDTGVLSGPNGDINVQEVRGRGDVQHTVETEHQLVVGDEVRGTVDWDTRYAHMRMHTAQHLMSGIAYELFNGVRTVGNQIHAEKSRIDFNPISFDEAMMERLVDVVNGHINTGLKVSDSVMTREEINTIMPPDRTNMNLLPASVRPTRRSNWRPGRSVSLRWNPREQHFGTRSCGTDWKEVQRQGNAKALLPSPHPFFCSLTLFQNCLR